jgi:O-antigen ligase
MADLVVSQSKPTTPQRLVAERTEFLRNALPGVVAGGMVAALGAHDGGYFPTAWGWGALAFLWVAAVALIVDGRAGLARHDNVFLAALVALLLWTTASALWTSSLTASVREIERLLVYVVGALALLLVTRRRSARSLLGGVLAGVAGVCAYGLATRLFPEQLGAFDALAGYRLSEPIGYWNGLGILAAVGMALAAGFAAKSRSVPGRALGGAALALLALALFFTFSRGAWIALALGFAAALLLDPKRVRLATSLLVLAPAPAMAVWLAQRSKALTTGDVPLADASREGHRLALALLGLAVLGALCAIGLHVAERRLVFPRSVRLAWAALLVCVLVAGLVGLSARYGNPVRIAERTWDAFDRPPRASEGELTKRLFDLSSNGRVELGQVALDMFEDNPAVGAGAGTFERYWLEQRPIAFHARDAHNLYLETLGELGPPGLAALLVALAVPLGAAVRARRRELVPFALAAYVAVFAHAAVDWDWELPAVTFAAIGAAVCLLVYARKEGEAARLPAALRYAVLGALTAVGAFVVISYAGNAYLAAGQAAYERSDFELAAAKARTAHRLAPWSSEPWNRLGEAQLGIGDTAAADASFSRALANDSENWDIWFNLAIATEGAEREQALAEATRLNPRSPQLAQFERAVGEGS